MSEMIEIDGVKMTEAAAANVEEAGVDVAHDLASLRAGRSTRMTLLQACVDGADDDRVEGWRDYVSAVALAAGR